MSGVRKTFEQWAYRFIDRLFVPLDRKRIRRTRNIRLIPNESDRRGGKHAYAEWAHVVGIFQTVIGVHLGPREGLNVVDFGCGTGLIGISCEPFLGKSGGYLGLDVSRRDIEFAQEHFPADRYKFVHMSTRNPAYAPEQADERIAWPAGENTVDLVTALSVWTHLNEEDALFNIGEVSRILKPGGTAIITCFLLDERYHARLRQPQEKKSRFHMSSPRRWVFDRASYGSDSWMHPEWASYPENAIGISSKGMERLISRSGLRLKAHYPRNWKEIPGVFFQDILVLEKGTAQVEALEPSSSSDGKK